MTILCICERSNKGEACECNRPAGIEQLEHRKCLCGRSLTDFCMSWHSLCDKVFLQKREAFLQGG